MIRYAVLVGGLMAIVLTLPVARGDDKKPAEELPRLKKDLEKSWEILENERKPGTTDAERKAAVDRYYERTQDLARRALALAETYPDAPEAPEALVWLIEIGWQGGPALEGSVRDAAYDLLARRYLDKEAILPVIRLAWIDASKHAHVETVLRAAADRSPNPKVRALAGFGQGRLQLRLLETRRNLDHPVRGEAMRKWLGPEAVGRIRALDPEELCKKAEAFYERTIREYGDMQPMGTAFPPLGQQARGDLFKLRHLEPGRTAPEIEREDIDGRPMKLSDFRGKVIALSFWATWCGPCMGMVPHEKALVERMKGRPFVLVGVNGDQDRSRAKEVVAKEGINWQSFWDGGRPDGIAVGWGINGWPTVYLIDARGVIRDSGSDLRGAALDKAVADLVAEAEAADKKP
jgi:thiol-disulfide isomerase/thioredoxin